MVDQLNTNIKDIIREHPAVAAVLEKHGIACVTCNVGTCLLKDIIEIHNLTQEQEHEVLSEIAEVLFPGQEVAIPRSERRPVSKAYSYSPPVKKLVDEHTHIKKLLSSLPSLTVMLRHDPDEGKLLLRRAIDFIRSYADRFHHAKEEEILFAYFDENAEIFQVMHQDHETARGHVAAITEALENSDNDTVVKRFEAYTALLTEHIRKEDEVLYPWIDRNLTMSQVGELYSRFGEVDVRFGEDPRGHELFANELESAAAPTG